MQLLAYYVVTILAYFVELELAFQVKAGQERELENLGDGQRSLFHLALIAATQDTQRHTQKIACPLANNGIFFYALLAFEFDEQKSEINREQHGIDFIQAHELWNGLYFIEILAKTVDEPRFVVIGLIKRKHWSAVMTPRSGKIRIISVRRARPEEVTLYES